MNNTTSVFDIDTTNILLARGHKLWKVRPNKKYKGMLVFEFFGNLEEEVNQILIDMGKRSV